MDLKYLAGFIDGEGCFNFSECRTSLIPRILITNTNLKVLQKIKAKYGGDIYSSVVKNSPHWKPRHVWRLQHANCLKLTEELVPYLIIKKRQAKLFMNYQKSRPGKGNKLSVKLKLKFMSSMQKLNKKGA